MAGHRRKRSYEDSGLAEDAQCDGNTVQAKRSRCSRSGIREVPTPGKNVRQPQTIIRPGIPPQTHLSSYRFPDKPSPPLRPDDKDGHYVYELGENLGSRYKVLNKIGEGTFGRVLDCWDRTHKDYVAIKLVRSVDKYRQAAQVELEVLNTLEKNDPDGTRHCVTLREWFDYRGHICMVFEKLGPSLYDVLRKNNYHPFPLRLVQCFTRQLLECVSFMHDLSLVHTDLKPENILLESSEAALETVPLSAWPSDFSRIKVIDFGSAIFENQYHSTVVSTRHYRAPEVILELGWSYPCDMWSLGCIIVELVTGDALFVTRENLEHLAMMQQVLGPIPEELVSNVGARTTTYFHNQKLHWPAEDSSRKSIKAVNQLSDLRTLLRELGDIPTDAHLDVLEDLVSRLLTYNPSKRMTAKDALAHQFFKLKF